jgi:hypothetical protein
MCVSAGVVDPFHGLARELVAAHQELCAACHGHVLAETVH